MIVYIHRDKENISRASKEDKKMMYLLGIVAMLIFDLVVGGLMIGVYCTTLAQINGIIIILGLIDVAWLSGMILAKITE